MTIRIAAAEDAEQILRIYAPYVLDTAVSFEYEVPDTESFRQRIVTTLRNYPYLAAEEEGRIVGYAYAGPFHTRAAYRHAAELSIYLDRDCRGNGIGKRLYSELERILVRQNVFVAYAGIAVTDRENDGNLTDGSVRFHTRMGYREAGLHRLCG